MPRLPGTGRTRPTHTPLSHPYRPCPRRAHAALVEPTPPYGCTCTSAPTLLPNIPTPTLRNVATSVPALPPAPSSPTPPYSRATSIALPYRPHVHHYRATSITPHVSLLQYACHLYRPHRSLRAAILILPYSLSHAYSYLTLVSSTTPTHALPPQPRPTHSLLNRFISLSLHYTTHIGYNNYLSKTTFVYTDTQLTNHNHSYQLPCPS